MADDLGEFERLIKRLGELRPVIKKPDAPSRPAARIWEGQSLSEIIRRRTPRSGNGLGMGVGGIRDISEIFRRRG